MQTLTPNLLCACAVSIFTTIGVAAPASADGLREVDQTIFGMDCAPCAYGIEQGLKKLPGVTAVRVSLNEGQAVVSLAQGSSTTLQQIREVVRDNGFTPKDARARMEGRLVREGERTWIDIGSGRFIIEAEERTSSEALNSSAEETTLWVRVPENISNPPVVQLIDSPQQRG